MLQLVFAAAFTLLANTPINTASQAVSSPTVSSMIEASTVEASTDTLSISAADYGKCSFDSDCHKGVKCNSSRCGDAEGSKCNFDSDCGGGGAKCNSSKCSNAPDGKCNFDSECPGKKCSSGKCK